MTLLSPSDPNYECPLVEAAVPIGRQSRTLCDGLLMQPDFQAGIELDYTLNGAVNLLNHFFEVVFRYEQGKVPWQTIVDVLNENDTLFDVICMKYPIATARAVGMAFRKCRALWQITTPHPELERGVYGQRLFAARDDIFSALGQFNAEVFVAEEQTAMRKRPAARSDAAFNDRRVAEHLKAAAFGMLSLSWDDQLKAMKALKSAARIGACLTPPLSKSVMFRILDTTGHRGGGSLVPQFWYDVCTKVDNFDAFAAVVKAKRRPLDRYSADELHRVILAEYNQLLGAKRGLMSATSRSRS